MRPTLALLFLAGCASGARDAVDALVHDGIDAAVAADAARADAAPTPDGRPADAAVTPDAPAADAAPMLDAAVMVDGGCVPVTTELLANPVFDLAPRGVSWHETPYDAAYPIITDDPGLAPQSAPYRAWLGGVLPLSGTATDQLYQDVVVPANTTKLEITGFYAVLTGETLPQVYDSADVALTQTNGTPIEDILPLSNLTVATTWTAVDHVVTATASGQTVRLRFTSSNDYSNETSFLFDTLSLKATHCP